MGQGMPLSFGHCQIPNINYVIYETKPYFALAQCYLFFTRLTFANILIMLA